MYLYLTFVWDLSARTYLNCHFSGKSLRVVEGDLGAVKLALLLLFLLLLLSANLLLLLLAL